LNKTTTNEPQATNYTRNGENKNHDFYDTAKTDLNDQRLIEAQRNNDKMQENVSNLIAQLAEEKILNKS